jgi:hypothetical protein
MSRQSKWEYLRKIYHRSAQASSKSKRPILEEFCANWGYHRKYAIRWLKGPAPRPSPPQRRKRRATYGPQVISVLAALWQAAGYPWSVRLKALLPVWMPWARKRFHLQRFRLAYAGQIVLNQEHETVPFRTAPTHR